MIRRTREVVLLVPTPLPISSLVAVPDLALALISLELGLVLLAVMLRRLGCYYGWLRLRIYCGLLSATLGHVAGAVAP